MLPPYERIAQVAKCARSTVAIGVKELEDAGLLTWVHRLAKICVRETDLGDERSGDVLSSGSAAVLPAGSCSPLPATGVSGSDRRLPPGRRTSGRGRFLCDGGTPRKEGSMASDITLAVGDSARRMTYADWRMSEGYHFKGGTGGPFPSGRAKTWIDQSR